MKTPFHPGQFRALFVLLAMLSSATSLHATCLFLDNAFGQYVQVPANTGLTPARITLEAWVNVPAAGQLTIVSRGNGDYFTNTDYIFQIGDNGGGAGTYVSFFGATNWDSSTSSIPVNTWTHVAVTFDGTNKLFYINGMLAGTSYRPGSLYSGDSATSHLYIGRQGEVCDCNLFYGLIAEVRIWNTVRTASEIAGDMNFSSGSQAGLVAYYHFNEGSGTTANDASGNGNTGTLTGGAFWNNSGPFLLGPRVEGPGGGTDSVVLSSPNMAWTATTNATWLHLSTANQSGTGSKKVIFSFDANPGATRTGTLTIAGLPLIITQAGLTYVAAPAVLATLISPGVAPTGITVDGAGNVYIAEVDNDAVEEWSAASNTVTTLASYPDLYQPAAVALDGAGNVIIADTGNNVIKEWSVASHTVTTLISGLNAPSGVAVDGAGNVFIADSGNNAVKEWTNNNVITLVSGVSPTQIAVDGADNAYFSDDGSGTIKEWSAGNQSVLASGLPDPWAVAVDGAGNVYFTDNLNNEVYEWNAVSSNVTTLVSSGLGAPVGVAVDGAGNVYVSDAVLKAIYEQPRAFLDPTAKVEGAAAGTDVLPVVLAGPENLGGPFAPTSSQSWLTISGTNNGVVSFSFTNNYGAARTAYITVLNQQIPVTQNAPVFALGASLRLDEPGAGTDSVVLAAVPAMAPWTATTHTPWLHLSAANQSGMGSTNVIFSFDANPGPTRSGTLTIAGHTLTVRQAGSNYVAATPLTVLVSTGLNHPSGLAVDSAGNMYIADTADNAVKEWVVANNSVTALVSSGLNGPLGVTVDASGNVYIADTTNNAVKEWSAASQTVSTLVSSGLNHPNGVAVDAAGNVYIADTGNGALKEWVAASNSVVTLLTGINPFGVAVDIAGNAYTAEPGTIREWFAATGKQAKPVTGLSNRTGVSVDGKGNVYIADTGNNAIKEWVVANNIVVTLVSPGLTSPGGVVVDGPGNIYIADTGNSAVKELPHAFVDPTPKVEGPGAGVDSLPMVLPVTENLGTPFAPSSSQNWLTITGTNSGVVGFAFSTNSGIIRTANITLLGETIPVTQYGSIGVATLLTGAHFQANGKFQFSFTNLPGATFTVLSTTNVSLPLGLWTPLGAPVESPPGQYQFTGAPATNAQTFYIIRSP